MNAGKQKKKKNLYDSIIEREGEASLQEKGRADVSLIQVAAMIYYSERKIDVLIKHNSVCYSIYHVSA